MIELWKIINKLLHKLFAYLKDSIQTNVHRLLKSQYKWHNNIQCLNIFLIYKNLNWLIDCSFPRNCHNTHKVDANVSMVLSYFLSMVSHQYPWRGYCVIQYLSNWKSQRTFIMCNSLNLIWIFFEHLALRWTFNYYLINLSTTVSLLCFKRCDTLVCNCTHIHETLAHSFHTC